MRFPGYFKEHILPEKLDSISLSFLVESLVRQRGGVAPNIAYTMSLLGARARLLATVGEDFGEYRTWLEGRGIDTANVRVIPGEYTASFFANTDRTNAQIASFYPGAMAYASQLSIADLEGGKPDLVVISPNAPDAMRRNVTECQSLGIPYIYDPSQQIVRLSDEDLHQGVEGTLAMFVNDYELGMIQKKTGLTATQVVSGKSFMVVTRGEKGVDLYVGGKAERIPAIQPERIADPTGVGDAFRGGFLVGYSHGRDLSLCAKMGTLAATYCLEESSPQGHCFTPQEFVSRFRRNFAGGEQLDVLVQ
jgi:adenosine kinase